MKIAIPCANKELCLHFGHCQEFFVADIDEAAKEIKSSECLVPPPHEPGLLPKWLAENSVTLVIAGGMGARAQGIFSQNNIKVVTGAQGGKPEDIIDSYLSGTLQTGANACDH